MLNKVKMLNSFANYLFGGDVFGTQDSRQDSNNESLELFPVMPRLSQVEVDGDDWILIDRAVEGATALEESWYVTPPACFTRAAPANVETSPLEDLLIEHPSMSVYRATASPVAPDTPPPSPDERDVEDVIGGAISVAKKRDVRADVLPGPRSVAGKKRDVRADVLAVADSEASTKKLLKSSGRQTENQQPNKSANRQGRALATQIQSAQKVLEKRSTQSLKRGHLQRSNKLREVFSVKGKRPRRQDRLRVHNSGANNNRKCY